MEKYQPKKGDIITVNAVIIAVTDGGNPIIRLNSGIKFLIKESDINTICPKIEVPKEDKRRGR